MRALAIALVLAAGCAARNEVVTPAAGPLPVTVAVLPLRGGNLDPSARAVVRREIGSVVEQRRYAKLDDAWVDERMSAVGLRPWDSGAVPTDAELRDLGPHLGAAALLLLDDFTDSSVNAVAVTDRRLTGRLRLLDGRTGDTQWEAEVGASRTGGLALESGQAVQAISEVVSADGSLEWVALVGELCLNAIRLLPESPSPSGVRRRPQVYLAIAFEHEAGDGRVEIGVLGTPGCRALASLPVGLIGYPLAEEAPGLYRGSVQLAGPVPRGGAIVSIVLRDPIGVPSRPCRCARFQ